MNLVNACTHIIWITYIMCIHACSQVRMHTIIHTSIRIYSIIIFVSDACPPFPLPSNNTHTGQTDCKIVPPPENSQTHYTHAHKETAGWKGFYCDVSVFMHAHTHAYMHTHTHTHTPARKHARTHAHAHKRDLARGFFCDVSFLSLPEPG